MKRMVMVGSVLYGYCGGCFGRDSYGEKRVEALGADWVVVRDQDGCVSFASGENILDELDEYTDTKHKSPEE
jgi:hypothetical protein